jgi:hypothetical protein
MRKMRKIIFGILVVLLSINCYAAKQTISIEAKGQSEVFKFAQQELKKFLSVNYELTDAAAPWQIVLQTNKELKDGAFCVEYKATGTKQQVIVSGSDESAMLDAVYTFLEKAGMRFEISGPVFNEKIDINKLKNYSETIIPKVKQRGIRQHINFTMDVSSYPIEEAKEYIRNLARLRFNYITFHSYPGQWYADPMVKKDSYAGNFFYGKRHDIPNDKFYQEKIRNKKTYCIPAIEPFFDDKPTREKMAIEWLQDVMRECKRVGLTVRLSFEPRGMGMGSDIQTTVETTKKLLSDYPMINELELITYETGYSNKQLSNQEVAGLLTPLFGQEILKDAVAMKLILSGNTGIADLFTDIGHNIKALDGIDKTLLKPLGIKGSLGLYVTTSEYLESAYHLLRKYAPNASYAVLPGHGSVRVSRFLPYADMEKKDWGKTMVYSWLEFDGLMYLQQNGIRGIRSLIEYGEDINGLDQIQSICFNHWRTAENKITARYAAESTLYGAQDETAFYTGYAKCYGIENAYDFAKAMKQIDEASWYATNETPNVGFCYALGSNSAGFGFLGYIKPANLVQGRELYEKALALVKSCSSSVNSKEGKILLALLDNRLRATIVYLKAYEKGVEIQQFDKDKLTAEQKKKIASIINETIAGFDKYIKLYSEMIPDRGAEGVIISAYYVRIDALKRIRQNLCGIPYEGGLSSDKPFDAPPPPISN